MDESDSEWPTPGAVAPRKRVSLRLRPAGSADREASSLSPTRRTSARQRNQTRRMSWLARSDGRGVHSVN